VEAYKRWGVRASGELCVPYLRFDASDYASRGARIKIGPPLRSGEREQLWSRLLAGAVEFVSSDHSGWPLGERMTSSIFESGAGMPGLPTLLPAFFTMSTERGLDASRMSAKFLAEKPARFFGIDHRKGAIKLNADGDFAVIKHEQRQFSAKDSLDETGWSAFDGDTFAISVAATYLRGRKVFDGTLIINSGGNGVYVPRSLKMHDNLEGAGARNA
jgi:allantoinase